MFSHLAPAYFRKRFPKYHREDNGKASPRSVFVSHSNTATISKAKKKKNFKSVKILCQMGGGGAIIYTLLDFWMKLVENPLA